MTSCPNVNDTPLSFSAHPFTSLSGSDHSKSQSNPINNQPKHALDSLPSSGTSVGLIILVSCSKLVKSGLKPPCIQIILSSMMAATGRQLKQSPNIFQVLKLYLLLPISHVSNSFIIRYYIHHRSRKDD